MKLLEGQNYLFKLEGLIELPDGKLYHRLSDPNEIKHLLPADPYNNYGIESMDEIVCHVDKINCSGKIFLEPKHPIYKEGEVYSFPIIGYETINNSDGIEEKEILVKDKLDNNIKVPAYWFPDEKNVGEKLKCRIGRIKKGELMLITVEDYDNTHNLKPGSQIVLSLSKIITLSGDLEFFVLVDDMGKKYFVRKKFYAEYDLKTGLDISCRVMLHNGEISLEPKHPHYSLGKSYDFLILREEFIEDYPEKDVPVVVVSDVYKKEYYLRKDQLSFSNLQEDSLNCIVAEILKGRLVLQCH